MSLITTCPHCSTSFRVTPDQLRLRAGKVRCGQCNQVFDGFQKLNALSTPAAATAVIGTPPAAPAQQEAAIAVAPEPQTEIISSEPAASADVPPMPPAQDAAPAVEPVASAPMEEMPVEETIAVPEPPDAEPINAPSSATMQQIELANASAAATEATSIDVERLRTQDLDMTSVPAEPPASPDAAAPAVAAPAKREPLIYTAPQPEPYVYAETPPPRRRTLLWALAAVVAAVVLAAQVLQVYRDELAAKFPGLKPALVQFCGYASCTVRPLQRPDALKIEASDLQVTDPARPNVIQLTATLRNYSASEVGYPALDLVLTDNREHTLVRRVFSAAEYLARVEAPVTSIAASAEVTVRIDIDVGNVAAAGFRLNLVSDISI